MDSKSHNIKFKPYNNVNKILNELFESLLSRYQDNLETSMEVNLFLIQFS